MSARLRQFLAFAKEEATIDTRLATSRAWAYALALPRAVPILVAVLAMLFTLLTTASVEQSRRAAQKSRLQADADEIALALKGNMTAVIFTLQSSRALFSTLKQPYIPSFRRFVNVLEARRAILGIRGIGLIITVKREDVAGLEQKMRDGGSKDYHVWPALAPYAAVAQPVVALEPDDATNHVALGFNVASEPKRYAAMQRAARSGTAVASESLILLFDRGQKSQPGFLVFVPVYREYTAAMTASEREAALLGFVYTPIRIAEQVAAVPNRALLVGKRLTLADGESAQAPVFYDTGGADRSGMSATQIVAIADRSWRLTLRSPQGNFLGKFSGLVMVFGTVFSLLLGSLTALILHGGRMVKAELQARQEYEGVRKALTRELTHRVKNTLATVVALAKLTKGTATNVDDYVQSLAARLQALSATHDLLTQTDWSDAPIRELLEGEFAPFRDGIGVTIALDGPEVALKPHIAVSFGMAIHELITNAAKYGALSVPGGLVSVRWSLSEDHEHALVEWRESNGPKVVAPSRRSFGSDLIERLTAREIGSEVKIVYDPGGVRCTMSVPVQRITTSRAESN